MRRLLVFIFVASSLVVFAACNQTVDVEDPPEIAYGQDACDRCSMIISEEKFAAAYWTKGGEVRRFDDIGGMLAYSLEESEDVASYWVHDFVSGAWIRAEPAHYILDGDLMTPMGFGIAAFADEEQAQAMVHNQEGIAIMPFNELLAMKITMPSDLHEAEHMHDGS